jgi:hypothetical protein
MERANVLWTGGWDSTFRVLQLVLVYKREVQPHYLVDPDRHSVLNELSAIRTIRKRLARRDPAAADRIGPLRLVATYDIPRDPVVVSKLTALRQRAELFPQYDFLTRYPAHAGIDDLELCFQADDHRPLLLLRDIVARVDDASGGYWRVDRDKVPADDPLSAFSPFRFPLLGINKVQMKAVAAEQNLLDIMEATWFCFNPRGRYRDRLCGRCAPCIDAVQEGMRYRLPLRTIAKYHLRAVWPLLRRVRRRALALRSGHRRTRQAA